MAALDLLRALGPRAPSFLPEAGQALNRLQSGANFATRYLLLAPAGVLASSDANALSLLSQALSDAKEPRLRVRALEVLPRDAIGEAALDALDALGPSDLSARLAPLPGTRAAPAVKHALSNAAKNETCARR